MDNDTSAGSIDRCKHATLRFHSGGHYVQCDDCKAWWIATKNAHTPDETIDFDRSSMSDVLGGDARRLRDPAQPPRKRFSGILVLDVEDWTLSVRVLDGGYEVSITEDGKCSASHYVRLDHEQSDTLHDFLVETSASQPPAAPVEAGEQLYRRRELGDGHVSYEPVEAQCFSADSAGELTCEFTQVLPGGKLDDSTYEKIETALDKIGAPCTQEGKWLSLHERIAALPPVEDGAGEPQEVQLGSFVHMNDLCPYKDDWRGAVVKVVSLRIAPTGEQWASVIEGEPRHRGNGFYDSETTDIRVKYLSLVSRPGRATP